MIKKKDWKYVWILLPLFLFFHAEAQTYTVGTIGIQGNRKTKGYIIERELSFKKGDTISIGRLVSAFRQRMIA